MELVHPSHAAAAGDPVRSAALPTSEAPDLGPYIALPKAELHLHLDGALRPATALELGRERRLPGLAGLTVEEVGDRLVAPLPCRDQAELLRAFELPVAILQDAESLSRATHELVLDLVADGVIYAEIRWAPSLHTRRGLRLPDVIRAVVAGARSGLEAARSSLVTAPARPVAAGPDDPSELASVSEARLGIRLIAVAMRSDPPEVGQQVARAALAFSGEWLTGFDLAGPEAAFPDPEPHRRAFEIARGGGLGITIHAGEWGGAAQVRRALAIEPWRIAHGAPAVEDPALLDAIRERSVTLDVCPTSNWQAGLVPRLADHPLPRLIRAGVPTTLSTDDPTVSAVTLSEEYRRAREVLGLDRPTLARLDRHAFEAAFLHDDEALRAALLGVLDAFVAAEPAWQG